MSDADVNELELGEQPDVESVDDDAGHRGRSWLVLQWFFLRCWFARGKAGSKYWVPRCGDRVHLRGEGCWLVYDVSIRSGTVQLGRPGAQRLEDISPPSRDDLNAFYGTSRWNWPPAAIKRSPFVEARPDVTQELELVPEVSRDA